ncbi:hypothetical protein HMH01_03175 [Halovulum dunhuangense]|uniref:Uncharacterized protein n=1 Tax=Halovulum dunhuangense TaxID=1505036 RepID=A0A849KUX4_9RHOB|nr:hypothetical protein [Halovulum dunhuangense]NNU79431.1 hypothetical protein [Halovulum dunhuangense]
MKPGARDVTHILGPLDAHLVAEILASGATVAELEEVAAYLAGADDVMGDLRRPLTGRAALVHDMLRRQDDDPDADR